MARRSSVKKGPVPHEISERGLYLERAQLAQQNSNIHHGEDVVVGQETAEDGNTKDILVKVGNKCPSCHKRVRGPNHANGIHHRGLVRKHNRR